MITLQLECFTKARIKFITVFEPMETAAQLSTRTCIRIFLNKFTRLNLNNLLRVRSDRADGDVLRLQFWFGGVGGNCAPPLQFVGWVGNLVPPKVPSKTMWPGD